MENFAGIIASELNQPVNYVENVITLLDDGNTIPFIARYRKEMHGAMDSDIIRELSDRLTYLRNLSARKEEIKKAIDSQGKLTDELSAALDAAVTLAEAEDIYLPYKQKRRTRASMAKEKGLEPLADALFDQGKELPSDITLLAAEYINAELGVSSAEDALAGASDIIAEKISDSADIRKKLRDFISKNGYLTASAAKDEDSVYSLYYEFKDALSKIKGHQVLALNRGEREGFLKVSVETDDDKAISVIRRAVIFPGSASMQFVINAAEDSWNRLIKPSMEREIRSSLTDVAAEGAIHNFALNLKPLLMQPPVKGHVTMGLDPGYRNGCKVAVIDKNGTVLDTSVVYPTFSEKHKNEAIEKLSVLVKKHKVEHIAIGNGTASRETERMTAELIKPFAGKVSYVIVNEAGASVYSASKLAADEFPQFDLNLRSAVSIARRLQDPLAELVKIDPKAIGVGQYQHDMPQKRLDETLSGVVEDCVNSVGVDLNTASVPLLQKVSGINSAIAKNIVAYRESSGGFTSKSQLKEVPKLGAKAFEQCAGFVRVPESSNPLDNTGVHPESYKAAKKLLDTAGMTLADVTAKNADGLKAAVETAGVESVAESCGVGIPTLQDLINELMLPGRDPRDELPPPVLCTDVMELTDLRPGMQLSGTVRNVIDFGAFVDIGVHQDGLVHISEICDRFIRHPSEALSVGDVVKVVVLDVKPEKKRISLSIKQAK